MKRQKTMALAAVFAMSVAGTALAAPANPFVDVPAKHWAYDSINKLAQAGIISGYGDGTYQGDKTLTRYEVATLVAKAMANSDKADAASKKEIEALKAEFGTELNNLGVRVDNLEKNASNVKFTGAVRARYNDQDNVENYQRFLNGDYGKDANNSTTRLRLNMEAEIDRNVAFHGRYEAESEWGTSAASSLTQAYITGKASDLDYSLGRQPIRLGQGLLADIEGKCDGLLISGGENLKVTAGAFKASGRDYDDYWSNDRNVNFKVVNIDAKVNNSLHVSLSYLKMGDDYYGKSVYKSTSVGLNYTGIKNFTVSGEYGQNDSDGIKDWYTHGEKAKAWMAKIKYAGVQKDKIGSFGAWLGYRKADRGFDPFQLTTLTLESGRQEDWHFGNLDNVKGAEFGVEYTVFRNGIFTFQYNDLEARDVWYTGKNKKNFYAQLEYSF